MDVAANLDEVIHEVADVHPDELCSALDDQFHGMTTPRQRDQRRNRNGQHTGRDLFGDDDVDWSCVEDVARFIAELKAPLR